MKESTPITILSEPRQYEYIYSSIILLLYCHLAGIYGLYLLCFTSVKWTTSLLAIILFVASMIGVTAGAHRLWSHRAYKTKLPLEIILVIFNSLCYQFTVIVWVRNHRLHHKYSDTDADPHNSSRGLFFSHIGWLMVKKHPDIQNKGNIIDISDVKSNPLLRFQKKYAFPLIGIIGYILPTLIPVYFFGESLNNAWHITMLRYILNLNSTFLINSVAHMYGYKPYDKTIRPVQSIPVSLVTLGEGFHNYHHSFPWDYRADELGDNWLNLSTKFIDFFAWIGWAYDLKTTSKDIITSRAKRFGDSSGSWSWKDNDLMIENTSLSKVSMR